MSSFQPYTYLFEAKSSFSLYEEQSESRFRKDIFIDILAEPYDLEEKNPELVADWPRSEVSASGYEPRKVGQMEFVELDFASARAAGISNYYNLIDEHRMAYDLQMYYMKQEPGYSIFQSDLRDDEFADSLAADSPECFLADMWLDPDHRKQGAGRKLLCYVYHRFFRHCTSLSACIFPKDNFGDDENGLLAQPYPASVAAKASDKLIRSLKDVGFSVQIRFDGTFVRVTNTKKWKSFYDKICQEWE